MTVIEEAKESLMDLNKIIDYLQSTSEDSWCCDVVKTKDGKNCLFGHLFDYGGGDNGNGSYVFEMFEELYATTYMVYPVNDGANKNYQQPTPKQRCIAYLENIRDGKEKTSCQLWDECV